MAKREPADFEVHQRAAFDALERRKVAEKAIVVAATELERAGSAGMHPVDVELRQQALLRQVRTYNAAERDFRAAQDALDERARKR